MAVGVGVDEIETEFPIVVAAANGFPLCDGFEGDGCCAVLLAGGDDACSVGS